jgi:DNA polymerase-3 subunit gamma/tau
MLVRRESATGSNDLHVVYRPFCIDEMLGNDINRNIIRNSLDKNEVSHTYLFVGEAGCGKTTAARVIALGLNCVNGVTSNPCLKCQSCRSIINQNSIDVLEVNVGQSGGKDAVDSIVRDLPSAPFNSRYKVIIFDEAHKLTPAAQDLLLKVIEDGFSHTFFIFCTNKPDKLKMHDDKAFMTRTAILKFNSLDTNVIYDMLVNVCEFEAFEYDKDVLKYMSEECEGVPRTALIWTKIIVDEGSWKLDTAKRLVGIGLEENDPQLKEFCYSLVKGRFKDSFKLFNVLKRKFSVESIRINTVGYFTSCLKNSKKVQDARKFSAILDFLLIPIYEQGRPAEYKFTNYMFKITDCINDPDKYVRRNA